MFRSLKPRPLSGVSCYISSRRQMALLGCCSSGTAACPCCLDATFLVSEDTTESFSVSFVSFTLVTFLKHLDIWPSTQFIRSRQEAPGTAEPKWLNGDSPTITKVSSQNGLPSSARGSPRGPWTPLHYPAHLEVQCRVTSTSLGPICHLPEASM